MRILNKKQNSEPKKAIRRVIITIIVCNTVWLQKILVVLFPLTRSSEFIVEYRINVEKASRNDERVDKG